MVPRLRYLPPIGTPHRAGAQCGRHTRQLTSLSPVVLLEWTGQCDHRLLHQGLRRRGCDVGCRPRQYGEHGDVRNGYRTDQRAQLRLPGGGHQRQRHRDVVGYIERGDAHRTARRRDVGNGDRGCFPGPAHVGRPREQWRQRPHRILHPVVDQWWRDLVRTRAEHRQHQYQRDHHRTQQWNGLRLPRGRTQRPGHRRLVIVIRARDPDTGQRTVGHPTCHYSSAEHTRVSHHHTRRD